MTTHDVIVIGGSYAGVSAALPLVRARRQVAVVDAGLRRNRFASHSHGFLGRDGHAPAAIVDEASSQLLAYPTATWVAGSATQAMQTPSGFLVTVNGKSLQARRLVLATGVIDQLPSVEGLSERWGRSVFHCPYCHGYELNQGRIGVLASSELAMHQALLLADWGTVTLLLNGSFEPNGEQQQQLHQRGVPWEATRIERVVDTASVELTDGRTLPFDGLFTIPHTRLASDLPQQLGCALEEGPSGACLRVNNLMETSVAGVFACGDAARLFGNVAMAVGDGAFAGTSVHRSLIWG